jgi:hypothetical protein
MRENARRTLLGGGAALVSGLLGAGLFGRQVGRADAATAAQPTETSAPPSVGLQEQPPTTELRLYGRGWQLQSDAPRAAWARPTRGQRSLVFGELLDAPADAGGTRLGELYATCTCVDAPFGPGPTAATSLEQHTLNLPDGTLTGMGTSQGDEGVFAIVGGTGRYAGARGSYTARQSPVGRGGDGTAALVVTLILDGSVEQPAPRTGA